MAKTQDTALPRVGSMFGLTNAQGKTRSVIPDMAKTQDTALPRVGSMFGLTNAQGKTRLNVKSQLD
jgi:hypothetical protein